MKIATFVGGVRSELEQQRRAPAWRRALRSPGFPSRIRPANRRSPVNVCARRGLSSFRHPPILSPRGHTTNRYLCLRTFMLSASQLDGNFVQSSPSTFMSLDALNRHRTGAPPSWYSPCRKSRTSTLHERLASQHAYQTMPLLVSSFH